MQIETLKVLKAIAHPKRVEILNAIKENNGNLCYNNLIDITKMAPTTLNFHLKKLENAEIIITKKVHAKYLLSTNKKTIKNAQIDFSKL